MVVTSAIASTILEHWDSKVKPNKQAIGNSLFIKYFAEHPEDQKKFKKFAHVPQANLVDSTDFSSQTLTVMNMLEKLIAGIGGNSKSLMGAQLELHKDFAVGYPQFKVFELS